MVCCPKAAPLASSRTEAASPAVKSGAFNMLDRICGSPPYCDSSITNSRESTSIIISMPPGNTLLVVISRSLCECHMNAQPRSLAGLACVFDGCKFVQFGVGLVPAGAFAIVVPGTQPDNARAVPLPSARNFVSARSAASGPKYGVPPYQAPLAKIFGAGSVAGPPLGTSPNGLASTGLLLSWHHS